MDWEVNPSGGSISPHPCSQVEVQGADMAIADWQEYPHRSIPPSLPSSPKNEGEIKFRRIPNVWLIFTVNAAIVFPIYWIHEPGHSFGQNSYNVELEVNPSGGSIVPQPIFHVVLQGADMAITDWHEWPHRSISSPLPSFTDHKFICIVSMQITL